MTDRKDRTLTQEERSAAREARLQYRRDWAKRNPDKIKAQQERYWAKKAGLSRQKSEERGDTA